MNVAGFAVLFDFGAEEGRSIGLHTQADVVRLYGHTVHEALEDYNVYTEFVETRKRPSRPVEEYEKEVPEHLVTLVISCGWDESDKTTRNVSKIECSSDCLRLSKRLNEAMYDWGKAWVYEHAVSEPKIIPGKSRYIKIKPFALNGESSREYLAKLDRLGLDIGRTIGDWCKEFGLGVRGR